MPPFATRTLARLGLTLLLLAVLALPAVPSNPSVSLPGLLASVPLSVPLSLTASASSMDLGRIGELLLNDDSNVRTAAVRELSQAGIDGLPLLESVLQHDRDPLVRWTAVGVVSEMHHSAGPEGVRLLVAALSDSDARIRAKAAEALGEQGAEALVAMDDISELLWDVDPVVRAAAASALGMLGPSATSVLPLLSAKLVDPEFRVEMAASKAIKKIDSRYRAEEAVPILIDVLKSRSVANVPLIVESLARTESGIEEAMPVFTSMLQNETEWTAEMRMHLMRALGKSAGALAVPALVHVLEHDDDVMVRRVAAMVLSDIDPGYVLGTDRNARSDGATDFWGDLSMSFFVSQDGNDEWSGRLPQPNAERTDGPFRTIQRAADIAAPGDVVYIRQGTYREVVRPANSGAPNLPIVFTSYEGEDVTVSGAEVLDGRWTVHEGDIYKTGTSLVFTQLFVDGVMMNEARWPNAEVDRLLFAPRARAEEGTSYDKIVDSHLPPGDWNGARVYLWPGDGWDGRTRQVKDYIPGKEFSFDYPLPSQDRDQYHTWDPYKPRAGNPYYLVGVLAALDTPTEWYFDTRNQELYLWLPDGDSPVEHLVEVKQRDYAFDLSGRSSIVVKDLKVFGAAIDMTDSRNCVVDNVHVRYPEHYLGEPGDSYFVSSTSNRMSGSNNEWRNSSIAYGSLSGLVVGGSGNRVTNCIIHDMNYAGLQGSPIILDQGSTGAVVSGNTIYNAGRGLITHHTARGFKIVYNNLYAGCLITSDNGGTYAWGSDGGGAEIAYNWVHGIKGVGIYLDNFCSNFVIHHNVIWDNDGAGIQLNSDSLNNLVYNNTIIDNGSVFAVYTYPDNKPNQSGTRIFNNLVSFGRMQFVTGVNAPYVSNNGEFPVDDRFVPVAGSRAIDAGIVVDDLPDQFAGEAPDIGAYEYGGEYWVPGADWALEE